tara:strand:- start:47 stop:1126 length:1080 start_codon:yes stop_codon:yes gene_type:complete
MKIVYIAETSLTNNSAYTHHVVKMCDAFSQLNHEVVLYLPKLHKNFEYENVEKKYLLSSKKKFKIKSLINFKLTNFFFKIFFLLQVLKNIDKDKPNIILTRSFLSSIILSSFKIKHILEIHSEFQSLTKFLMINLNYINSNYITKKILISESLNKIFKFNTNEYIVLHDGVDMKNFTSFNSNSNIEKVSYVGSFYKGRGIELIFHLAQKFPNLMFELYGQANNNFKTDLKNVKIYDYVNYCNVPTILRNADLLLMPYSKKVSVRSKNLNTADYCSPLKMFDYLAAGRVIVSSKLNGICEVLKHKKNAIIVEDFDYKAWEKEINNILNNKYDITTIQKNAFDTANEFTWVKRVSKILNKI